MFHDIVRFISGVYDLFNYKDRYGKIVQYNPIYIENQLPKAFVSTYDPEIHDLALTFPKAKEQCPEKPHSRSCIQDDIIWQVSYETHKPRSNMIKCHRGYFKLDEKHRTKIDLRDFVDENELAWIRVQGYDMKNPQRRAWFQAIKGPMFGKTRCKLILCNCRP